jgi:hypothetical protein
MEYKENEKARKYAGQLISIKRKTTILSVNDRLSHVDESAEATYLELLHPAAVYRMSILGDIQKGLSAIANIRPEDIRLLSMRLKFTEKIRFDSEVLRKNSVPANGNAAFGSDAFTVVFAMGRLKGKTPGGYLSESTDKDAAVKELQSQYDFLAQNIAKYSGNQKMMNAIKNAIEYYDLGALDENAIAPSTEEDISEVVLYASPEKTFRKDTKTLLDGRKLTKCYQIQILFIPSNEYPYQVMIRNRYGLIDKDPKNGLERIRSVEKEVSEPIQYKMSLTSGEMVSVIGVMEENLDYYKSCVYKRMRTIDKNYQEANRKAWKPQ